MISPELTNVLLAGLLGGVGFLIRKIWSMDVKLSDLCTSFVAYKEMHDKCQNYVVGKE